MTQIQTTTLDNGARVVTEAIPHSRSVSAGFWVGVGARDEEPERAGASHFLEHLLFKGTETRSVGEIAEAVESVGGEMNAFTTHEHTAFHTRLPADALGLGLDILGDVFRRPALRPLEVEAERQVILEELLMEEDCYDERILSVLAEAMFPGHPLGAEVLGTRHTIASLARDQIVAFHRSWYRPGNLVVAAAGHVDHETVVGAVDAMFPGAERGPAPVRRPPSTPARPLQVLTQPSEQVHLAVGLRALSSSDDDRYALAVANQVLGGGTTSRLFRAIREDRGLAYSVYSYTASFTDTGALVAVAATAPSGFGQVLGLVQAELDRLLGDGVTEHELEVAKGYLEGSTVLALEDPGSCMCRLAYSLLVHGEVPDLGEVIDRYRQVAGADVARALQRVAGSGGRTVAVVGPIQPAQLERAGLPTPAPATGGPSPASLPILAATTAPEQR